MDLNLTAASSELSNPPSITSGATPLDSTIEFRPDVSTPAPISSAATHIATAPSARIASISSSRSGPTASGYSEATEGVLARLQEQAASGSYNEAREHILSSIVTSDRLPVLPPITNGSRGRGRPRGSGKRKDNSSGSAVAATSTPGSGRRGRGGRPRGRPRGGGRTGKRKRADSEESELSGADGLSEDSEDESAGDSDGTSTNINLPTLTKSGRKINRPAPFVPVISSPNSGPKKKRAYRRNPENAVCKSCERGHSPTDNAIVFCDGCGSAYHQYCHTPPIGKDVVQIPEMEWFCVACVKGPAGTITPVGALGDLSTGQNMSVEEKRSALSVMTQAQLVNLLLHVNKTYPTLAIFPTSPSSLIRLGAMADTEDHYDGYETDPPQHYPKAGNGLARTLPPESEDLPWLIDDNFEVFAHQVNYQTPAPGTNGTAPLTGVQPPSGIPPNVSARAAAMATGAPSPAASVPAVVDVSMTGF